MSNQTDTQRYIAYLNQVSNDISYYYLWITYPFGLLGNLISLLIYLRPNLNRKTNTGFLYAWLSVFNTLNILQYIFLTRSSVLFRFTVNMPCGAVNYIRRSIFNFLSWQQVLISFDRFMAVVYPTSVRYMRKKWVLVLFMIGLFALVLSLNFTNLVTNWNGRTCEATTEMSIATSIIALLMRIFVPYLFMLALNILVILRLKDSKKKVGPMMFDTNGKRIARKAGQLTQKEYKFTVATLVMDFIFIVMHIPVGAWLTMSIVDQIYDTFTIDPLVSAIYRLFSNIAQLVAFSYSMSMISSFIIFNRNFRDELIGLLRLRRFFGGASETKSDTQTQTQTQGIGKTRVDY